MANGMEISIKNYAKLCKNLQAMNKDAEKAISRTVSDFKSRAPGWISQAVSEEYTIKKSEVKGAMTGARKIGSIKVSGTMVDNIGLEYKGRLLTPLHFKMKPKKPKAAREKDKRLIPGENVEGFTGEVAPVYPIKAYQISVEIHKGQVKNLPSSAFLGTNKGEGYIPFQRTGDSRTPITSIKSTSVPQMITNEKVAEEIQRRIEEGMIARLNHNAEQMLSK